MVGATTDRPNRDTTLSLIIYAVLVHTRLDSTIERLVKEGNVHPFYLLIINRVGTLNVSIHKQWGSNANYGLRNRTRLRRGCPRRKADEIR